MVVRINYFPESGGSDAVYVDPKTREDRLVGNLITAKSGYGTIPARKNYRLAGKTSPAYGKRRKRPFVPTWCKFCGAAVAYGTISKMRLRSATAWIDTCDGCAAG